jgi:hypothetical protein
MLLVFSLDVYSIAESVSNTGTLNENGSFLKVSPVYIITFFGIKESLAVRASAFTQKI